MKSRRLLNKKRIRREIRTRTRIFGSAKKPRLTVFRSNKFTYAQLINDEASKTLASVSQKDFDKEAAKKTKTEKAAMLGEALAKKAEKMGISHAVFDRRAYKYHGRVKALADGARKGGLKI